MLTRLALIMFAAVELAACDATNGSSPDAAASDLAMATGDQGGSSDDFAQAASTDMTGGGGSSDMATWVPCAVGTATTTTFTVTGAGTTQTVTVHDPRKDKVSCRAAVVLHSTGDEPAEWLAESDARGFLFVSFRGDGGGNLDTNPTYLADVIAYLEDPTHSYNVDANHIFIDGFSAAAGFFQKIICDSANVAVRDQLKAVAIDGNALRSIDKSDPSNQTPRYQSGGVRACPTPPGPNRTAHFAHLAGPLPAFILFGQSESGTDSNLCQASSTEIDPSIASCIMDSAEEMNYWSKEVNGCSAITPGLPASATFGGKPTTGPPLVYDGQGCMPGGATRLMVVPGQTHLEIHSYTTALGTQRNSVQDIWAFFSQF